jgi:hypothetical protein
MMENAGDVGNHLPARLTELQAKLATSHSAGQTEGDWQETQRCLHTIALLAEQEPQVLSSLNLDLLSEFVRTQANSPRSAVAKAALDCAKPFLVVASSEIWLEAWVDLLLQKSCTNEKKFISEAAFEALQGLAHHHASHLLMRILVDKRSHKNIRLVARAAQLCVQVAERVCWLRESDEERAIVTAGLVLMSEGKSVEARKDALKAIQVISTRAEMRM